MLEFAKEFVMQHIAHIAQDKDGSWRAPHDLREHLCGVAKLAAAFAQGFAGDGWAGIAAMLHDLGKYQPNWQHYIRKASGFEAEAHIDSSIPVHALSNDSITRNG